jgi:hypothetical protein
MQAELLTMKHSAIVALAASLGLAGAALSFAPAQAGVVTPSLSIGSEADSGIVKVHDYKRGGKWRKHMRKRGKVVHLIVPHYVPAYTDYPAYRSYGRGPGVSLNFSIGGGGRRGGDWDGGHDRWDGGYDRW